MCSISPKGDNLYDFCLQPLSEKESTISEMNWAKIKFISYNSIYMGKIADFRNMCKENNSEIPAQWIYKSINALDQSNKCKPVNWNYNFLNSFHYLATIIKNTVSSVIILHDTFKVNFLSP